MAQLQLIIVFYLRHFIRHLGICNQIYVSRPPLMYSVIAHNSVKKLSLYINKRLNYKLEFFSAAILSAIIQFVIGFLSDFYN